MKTRTLPCNVDNWRSDYRQYRASHHPAVGAALPAGSLKYRLSQFLRRAKTDLSCLDGDIQEQLDSFKVVVSGDIDCNEGGEVVSEVCKEREREECSPVTERVCETLEKMECVESKQEECEECRQQG